MAARVPMNGMGRTSLGGPSTGMAAQPASSSSSSPSSRNCVLQIPNAKASKYIGSDNWSFLALGELAVYQVQYSQPVARGIDRAPPPVPSSPSSAMTPTSSTDAGPGTGTRRLPPLPPGGTLRSSISGASTTSSAAGQPPSYNQYGTPNIDTLSISNSATPPRPGTESPTSVAGSIGRLPSPVIRQGATPNLHLNTQNIGSSPLARAPSPRQASQGIVFCVRNTEFPISQDSTISFIEPNSYVIDNGQGNCVKIELDMPRSGSHAILDNIIRKQTSSGVGVLAADTSAVDQASGTSTPELRAQDFRQQLLLIDENTGKVLGPLSQQINIDEAQMVAAGEQPGQVSSQDPVLVQFPTDASGAQTTSGEIRVSPFQELTSTYGRSNSKVVGAAEYVSRGILFAAEYAGSSVSSAAAGYKARTRATDSPMVFSPTTKKSIGAVAGTVEGAAGIARKGIGMIGTAAEKVGATAVTYGSKGVSQLGLDGQAQKVSGNSSVGKMKGLFQEGLQAVTTVIDGVEKSGKHLLDTSRQSTNEVVQHRFGDEARDLANQVTGIGSNVVLVYVDARGVMHRALLKRVGKGAIKARMKDGREVVLDDAGLQDKHTERDEKGNLIVVDEKDGQRLQVDSFEKLEAESMRSPTTPSQNPLSGRQGSLPAAVQTWFGNNSSRGFSSAVDTQQSGSPGNVQSRYNSNPAPPPIPPRLA